MGATDMLAFGKGNELLAAQAAANALGGPAMATLQPRKFMELYRVMLKQLDAQEAYDREHRKTARVTGQVVGGVASVVGAPEIAAGRAIAAGGRAAFATKAGVNGASAAARGGKAARPARGSAPILAGKGRLAANQSTSIARKVGGTTVIAGAGGSVAGAGGELAAQAAEGDFDARGVGAAAAGGLVDGLVTKAAGSSIGGAVGGVTDAALREGATAEDLMQGWTTGATLGRAGRFVGTNWSESRTPHEKGLIGEQLSIWNALAEGRLPREKPKPGSNSDIGKPHYFPIPDRKKNHARAGNKTSVPDLGFKPPPALSTMPHLESKFGPWSELSKGQKALFRDPSQTLDVDHWLPIHVGNSLGAGISAFGTPFVLSQDPPDTQTATEWFPAVGLRLPRPRP
jgi:hypothetical protein